MRTGAEHLLAGHEDDPPSQRVLNAVMEVAGYDDPTEFDACLYDVVDPDALDALFRGRTCIGIEHVTFSLDGFEVCVHGNGQVDVLDD